MKKNTTKAPDPIIDASQLDEAQANQLLLDLSNTIYWHAVLKLVDAAVKHSQTALQTLDPFKEPTQTARTQGSITGVKYVPDYVDALVRMKKEKEKEASGL